MDRNINTFNNGRNDHKEPVSNGFNTSKDFNVTDIDSATTQMFHFTVSRSFVIALTAIAFYIVIALGLHKWNNRHRRNIPKVNHLCFLCAAIAFLLCLTKLAELWIGGISCYIYHWLAASLYAIGNAFIYTVLWARQRKLHSNQLVSNNTSETWKKMSALTIILIYVFVLATCFAFPASMYFKSEHFPCKARWKIRSLDALLPVSIVFVSVCFASQFLLFYLIVNPLIKQKNVRFATVICATLEQDIQKLILRLAFSAFACGISSILLSVFIILDAVGLIHVDGSLSIGICMDLIVSTLAIVWTFADWRQRLFPMLAFKLKHTTNVFLLTVRHRV
ncbi:unnamed protein product [Clavelina lepadiformis]|uniref:G-protein coupled receptors family 1 profile domain-containing protein n=1 Tax=Clavelina lepadiformis TaxID=159417 RepID=A0ABP0GMA7_CLALP